MTSSSLDADWNDGMDLGSDRGESVAFTALYAGNLADLADLVDWLRDEGHDSFELAAALAILLDGVSESDPVARRARLDTYTDALLDGPSGHTTVSADACSGWPRVTPWAQRWSFGHEGALSLSPTWWAAALSASSPVSGPTIPPWPFAWPRASLKSGASRLGIRWSGMSGGGPRRR